MSKKVLTLLLVAVFALAQFSMASAAVVAGDASITSVPDFANALTVDVDWAVTGMAAGTKNVLIWSRIQADPPAATYTNCMDIATIIGTSDASGTFTYDMTLVGPANGDVVEFIVTVDSDACAGAPYVPVDTDAPMGDVTVDTASPNGFIANPPTTDDVTAFNALPVACNTFEMWGVASDDWVAPDGYSGFGTWNQSTTGTFAVPAPIGADDDLLSWPYTLPATASGPWSFSVNPEDAAGNNDGVVNEFRLALGIAAGETDDCVDFPDVGGNEYELYVRYLATLDLISGFADGTYGPDLTLTRAEAATLFEKANGWESTDVGFPTAPPSADCTFTDVAATDWFAGWVWLACDDGFMNGVGGGLFDPNNLLTRGQIVTIFNNINVIQNTVGIPTGYLRDDGGANRDTVLNQEWNNWGGDLRHAAWTDVSIGAFYAMPAMYAYEVGVAEGTSATTFSPDSPTTRGEFASMLYRALSVTENH